MKKISAFLIFCLLVSIFTTGAKATSNKALENNPPIAESKYLFQGHYSIKALLKYHQWGVEIENTTEAGWILRLKQEDGDEERILIPKPTQDSNYTAFLLGINGGTDINFLICNNEKPVALYLIRHGGSDYNTK